MYEATLLTSPGGKPSQDKVLGLEAEVAALQDRLKALELERAQHRAQLEALSQQVTSRNGSVDLGPRSPDAGGRPAQVRSMTLNEP